MRRAVRAFLAAVMTVAALMLCVFLPCAAESDGSFVLLRGTPELDGAIDECWSFTPAAALTLSEGKDTGLRAELRGLWDERGIYLLVTVEDPTQVDERTLGRISAFSQRDCVIFSFDPLLRRADSFGNNAEFKLEFTPYGEERGAFPEYSGRYSCVCSQSVFGYVVECFIELPTAPEVKLGFECAVSDNIDGSSARGALYTLFDRTGEAYRSPACFGTAELSPEYAQPEPVEEAPATSDGTLLCALCLSAAGALSILLRRRRIPA